MAEEKQEKDFYMSVKGNILPTQEEKESYYRESLKQHCKFVENKLDQDLGFYFWKRYTAAAFWTQIGTPINLLITLMTALTTAQSASSTILSQEIYQQLAIATLVVTTINTFFRPHVQLAFNTEQLQKWNEIGIEFENVYYSKRNLDSLSTETIEIKVVEYKQVQEKINTQRKAEGVGAINFITDLCHLIAMRTCIRKYKHWLDRDREIQKRAKMNDWRQKKEEEIIKVIKEKQDELIKKKIEADFQITVDKLNLQQQVHQSNVKTISDLLSFTKISRTQTNKTSKQTPPKAPPPTPRESYTSTASTESTVSSSNAVESPISTTSLDEESNVKK